MKTISLLIVHVVKLKHSNNHSVVKTPVWQNTSMVWHFQFGLVVHSFFPENTPKVQRSGGLVPIMTASPLEMPLLFIWEQISCSSYGLLVSMYNPESWCYPLSLNKKKRVFNLILLNLTSQFSTPPRIQLSAPQYRVLQYKRKQQI